jgi:hypothetical protein
MNGMCLGSFECRCAYMWPFAGPFRGWVDHKMDLDNFSSLTHRKWLLVCHLHFVLFCMCCTNEHLANVRTEMTVRRPKLIVGPDMR